MPLVNPTDGDEHYKSHTQKAKYIGIVVILGLEYPVASD